MQRFRLSVVYLNTTGVESAEGCSCRVSTGASTSSLIVSQVLVRHGRVGQEPHVLLVLVPILQQATFCVTFDAILGLVSGLVAVGCTLGASGV